MKRVVGIVTGGIIMSALATAAFIPAAAGPPMAESLGELVSGAFDSVEEAFDSTWEKAFDKSWRETFKEGVDEEARDRFRGKFRASFGDTFKAAFRQAWTEELEGEAAQMAHADEIGSWDADGTFDSDKIQWEDTLTFEESAEGLRAINLSTVNGKVEIDGTDGEEIRIVAHRVVRSTDQAGGAAYREQFRPILTKQDGTLVVHTHYHKKGEETPKHIKDAKMSYQVWLPSRFVVSAKTVNGTVEVKDTTGDATLHTVNGALTFVTDGAVSGGVHGKTVNGGIIVRAAGFADDSHLETVNGGIDVRAGVTFGGGLHAKTLNGSVKLSVPTDAAFDLSSKVGMHGSIRTAWGRPEQKRKMFGSSFETSVNGGGESVHLETFNGSVEVDTAD
ncbi:MAG: hypothetical protein ABGY41_16165 [Candidatus Poribacteria bacterium]